MTHTTDNTDRQENAVDEHVKYTGPLRWHVCKTCHEPWPCRIAQAQQAGADTADRAMNAALSSVGGTTTSSEEQTR